MSATVDAASLTRWIREFRRAVAANRDLLTRLDSVVGDADHGINMDRGLAAVVTALAGQSPPTDVSALLRDVGTTVMSAVGGTSGALYGTFFLRMAIAAGQEQPLEALAFARALRAGLEGVLQRGKAVAGDKTMVDALAPALDALDATLASGAGLGAALRSAALAAQAGRDATIPMLARGGRASFLGERSIGHQDPGATSAALLIKAAATVFSDDEGRR